jgi:hypothetical protein
MALWGAVAWAVVSGLGLESALPYVVAMVFQKIDRCLLVPACEAFPVHLVPGWFTEGSND